MTSIIGDVGRLLLGAALVVAVFTFGIYIGYSAGAILRGALWYESIIAVVVLVGIAATLFIFQSIQSREVPWEPPPLLYGFLGTPEEDADE